MHKLVGPLFGENKGDKWKVRTVIWRDGDDELQAKEEAYEGLVLEYYPCPRGRKDPGAGHASIEWRPVEWMKGRNSMAKWL